MYPRSPLLLALALAACHPAVEVIPVARTACPVEAVDSGLRPARDDRPLAWRRDGTILFVRSAGAYSGCIGQHICAGSGLYQVDLAGHEQALLIGKDADSLLSDAAPAGAHASSDGALVALRCPPSIRGDRICLIDVARRELRAVRVRGRNPLALAWSPDDAWIAFTVADETGAAGEVYRVHPDGSGQRALPFSPAGSPRDLVWGPGDRLTAWLEGDEGPRSVHAVKDGMARTPPAALARARRPALSPDGRWLAYYSVSEPLSDTTVRVGAVGLAQLQALRFALRLARADGTAGHVLFTSADTVRVPRGFSPFPRGMPFPPYVWSPDGQWLAFARGFLAGQSLWIIRIDGTGLRQITQR